MLFPSNDNVMMADYVKFAQKWEAEIMAAFWNRFDRCHVDVLAEFIDGVYEEYIRLFISLL